jgi:NADH-quinone oxidoreductase subunit K
MMTEAFTFLTANSFINISVILFILGLWAMFVMRHNLIIVLMAIELILLSVNLLFVFFSLYLDDLTGQAFSLYILTVAAAESAIGLAILVAYYRLRGSISIEMISFLKG